MPYTLAYNPEPRKPPRHDIRLTSLAARFDVSNLNEHRTMAGSKPKVSPNASSYDKKYFQLWRRFYEPLVMLKILGSTRGEHSAKPEQPSPVHRFLDNLAYLSDHVKGGSTTSAIGLENAPKRFNFWIASNEPKQSDKSAPFLASILRDVRTIADSPTGGRASLQEKLVRRCIEFAKHRVKKEAKMLMSNIKRCIQYFTSPEGQYTQLEVPHNT